MQVVVEKALPAPQPVDGSADVQLPRFDRVGELVKIEQHEHALKERAARPRLEPVGKLELVRHRVIRALPAAAPAAGPDPRDGPAIPQPASRILLRAAWQQTAVNATLFTRSRSRPICTCCPDGANLGGDQLMRSGVELAHR
jgi:hypothetical protein